VDIAQLLLGIRSEALRVFGRNSSETVSKTVSETESETKSRSIPHPILFSVVRITCMKRVHFKLARASGTWRPGPRRVRGTLRGR
jgi:hypothetical protein